MKKNIKYILLLLVLLLPLKVFAGASGSAPASVENGSNVTFTVTVTNTAAWNLKLSGSGSTSGCSNSVADVTANGRNTTKSFTVTCKATSVGTINFKATGDITSEDGANSNISITKSVSVVKPREKDTENRLASLSVDGYSIDFNRDNTSYSINVNPDVTSININASAVSSRASVSGTGTKEIDLEGNKFDIVCTAENGSSKVYTINVSVVDQNPIKVNVGDKEYTIVKSRKLLTAPVLTTETETTIGDIKVPSYTNEKSNIVIIGLKDSDGYVKYAVYKDNVYTLYNENKSSELLLLISKKELDGYEITKVTINNVEYDGYNIDDRFKLVYAMDLTTGEYNFYKYDTKDNNFQYFNIESKTEVKKKNNSLLIICIILVVLIIILITIIVYLLKIKNHKKKKKDVS